LSLLLVFVDELVLSLGLRDDEEVVSFLLDFVVDADALPDLDSFLSRREELVLRLRVQLRGVSGRGGGEAKCSRL
jgi:hypothetical protein